MMTSTVLNLSPVPVEESDAERSSTCSDPVIIEGELENQEEVQKLSLHTSNLWALGISIALGGQYIGWNKALSAGFGSMVIATFLISSAYWCLILCIAEVSSAIPFGGGSYAIARVTLGFFPGYMVAFMEAGQSVIFVATSAVAFGDILTYITQLSRDLEPLYWLFFIGSLLLTQLAGGKTFWQVNMAVAVLTLCIILMCLFGSIPDYNFLKHAPLPADNPLDRWFHGGGMAFMRILPLPCWFFVGTECVNLSCKNVPRPREQVPWGYVASMTTLFCTSWAILLCCISLPPGIETMMHVRNPMRWVFEQLFDFRERYAAVIALPALYATASGFTYCYSRHFKAMAKSGLINPCFAKSPPNQKTPVNALLMGSSISCIMCVIVNYVPYLGSNHLFNISMLCAISAYASNFASFVIFRYKFTTIKREFSSPLGIAGAVYGFLVFFLAFLGICAFQHDRLAVIVFVLYILLVVGYYFYAAQERQCFSAEEKTVMFRAYLMKSNNDRNKRIRKGKTAAALNSSTVSSPRDTTSSHTVQQKYKPSAASSYSPTNLSPRVGGAICLSSPPRGANAETVHTVASVAEVTEVVHYDHDLDLEEQAAVTPLTALPSTNVSAKSNKSVRRIKLLVNTGSNKIAMSGVVYPTDGDVNIPVVAGNDIETGENTLSEQVEQFSLFNSSVEEGECSGNEDGDSVV